jgi:hypothetical protein
MTKTNTWHTKTVETKCHKCDSKVTGSYRFTSEFVGNMVKVADGKYECQKCYRERFTTSKR